MMLLTFMLFLSVGAFFFKKDAKAWFKGFPDNGIATFDACKPVFLYMWQVPKESRFLLNSLTNIKRNENETIDEFNYWFYKTVQEIPDSQTYRCCDLDVCTRVVKFQFPGFLQRLSFRYQCFRRIVRYWAIFYHVSSSSFQSLHAVFNDISKFLTAKCIS